MAGRNSAVIGLELTNSTGPDPSKWNGSTRRTSMSDITDEFRRWFEALDRSGGEDRCYLCRRAPAEVKQFFGFDEDGQATEAATFGLEDVTLEEADILSYRSLRPVCAVCQLNLEGITALGEGGILLEVLRDMREERDKLWP